ncbi:telomere-protecting terminal protein Tpg [Streptomyces gibsoniae]|uniref:Helix-turn-helix transcriptional regulator n=1 Tax=Streptomyces gibsoniae TaxID=3075529 RepID=A0ABU2U9Q8_9ACTN|nr:helix-turn-helix transcriptional regulator [Streptomyces sp. DSM 41699]MDT0469692.1 helix-turn-helix transcriptional regulator [Streptomyces sp. DSM 41699]
MADSIGRALSDAERAAFTRPIPKSVGAQLNFLLKQAKGSTRQLAEMLGVSPRQALRYRKGESAPPAGKLRKAVEDRWQPRVRQRARQQAAQRGIQVELRARFGFTAAPGTTDDARMRRITQSLPPAAATRLLDAATEAERRQVLGDGLGQAYFRDGGRRAAGLEVEVTDIDYIDVSL